MRTFTKATLMTATMLSFAGVANAEIRNEYLLSDELTIAENSAKVQNFSTLMAAVEAAGLSEALMGEGPFTVFAPLDSAFDALPEGTVEELLKPENVDELRSLISAHVVPAKVTEADLDLAAIGGETAEIDTISVDVMDGKVTMDSLTISDIMVEKKGDTMYVSAYTTGPGEIVNDATIIEADIMSSNGVIHVIDSVLSPNS